MNLRNHLEQRGMTPSFYNLSYDEVEGVVTFFLYDFCGNLNGYQQYRPFADKKKKNDPRDGRYYTYNTSGKNAFFGLEYTNGTNLYFVVEGVFNAAKLHTLGYQAVAVLGNNPKPLKSLFRVLRRKYKLVALGDNDSAGLKLVNFVGCGSQLPADLDDMSNQEVHTFLKQFI